MEFSTLVRASTTELEVGDCERLKAPPCVRLVVLRELLQRIVSK